MRVPGRFDANPVRPKKLEARDDYASAIEDDEREDDEREDNPLDTVASQPISSIESMGYTAMTRVPRRLREALRQLGMADAHRMSLQQAAQKTHELRHQLATQRRQMRRKTSPGESRRLQLLRAALASCEGRMRAMALGKATDSMLVSSVEDIAPQVQQATAEARIDAARRELSSSASVGEKQTILSRLGNPAPSAAERDVAMYLDAPWAQIEKMLRPSGHGGAVMAFPSELVMGLSTIADMAPPESEIVQVAASEGEGAKLSSWLKLYDEVQAIYADVVPSIHHSDNLALRARLLAAISGDIEGLLRVAYEGVIKGEDPPIPLAAALALSGEAPSPPPGPEQRMQLGQYQDNPVSDGLSLEDLPDVPLERVGNPTHEGAGRAVEGPDEREVREDAAALGLPPDHVIVVAIGKTDKKLLHEALEAVDAMKPMASSKAKAHLLEHMERYLVSKGAERHTFGKPQEAMRQDNPLSNEALLVPGMNRSWRRRDIALPASVASALSEIVVGDSPSLATLSLSQSEGAVSLSQIDAALAEVRRHRKSYKPRSKVRVLMDAVEKDLALVRARPYVHRTAQMGYDLRDHGVRDESRISV